MSEHVSEDVAEHVRRAAEGVRRVAEGVRSMSCHNVVSLRPDLQFYSQQDCKHPHSLFCLIL